MEKKESPTQVLNRIYKSLRKWILYFSLIFILVIVYWGDAFGDLRYDIVPALIVAIVTILFEVLTSLEENVVKQKNKLEFPIVSEAIPFLSEFVKDDKDRTIIDVIASTGGTTISSVLPALINTSKASKIVINVLLINPKSPFVAWFPRHWVSETEIVLNRIQELRSDRVKIDIYLYDSLPVLHGISINKSHLILGFFGWKHYSGKVELSGAERPHRYYNQKESDSEYYFDLFEDWLTNCPRTLVTS